MDINYYIVFNIVQTAFLITARLKSKRLPKKIILEVNNKPLIVHMINRIKHAKKINRIILCTSTNKQDDPLIKIALKEKIDFYRGSENDVLQRLLKASKKFKLNYFANITADIPMIDPFIIDKSIKEYFKIKPDLLIPEDYSLGACLVVNVASLEKVCLTKMKKNTEIWVKFFQSHNDFYIHTMKLNNESKNKNLKTSLDYAEDYVFIKKIFKELYKKNRIFKNKDIIDLIKKKPEISMINSNPKHLLRWKNHINKVTKKS